MQRRKKRFVRNKQLAICVECWALMPNGLHEKHYAWHAHMYGGYKQLKQLMDLYVVDSREVTRG